MGSFDEAVQCARRLRGIFEEPDGNGAAAGKIAKQLHERLITALSSDPDWQNYGEDPNFEFPAMTEKAKTVLEMLAILDGWLGILNGNVSQNSVAAFDLLLKQVLQRQVRLFTQAADRS